MFNNNTTVTAGLVAGRHEMPVDLYVFKEITDLFDFARLHREACDFLREYVGTHVEYGQGLNSRDYTDVEIIRGNKSLTVFVTGLTAATAALISACAENGIDLKLMHYDRESGEYKAQQVLAF